MTRIDFYEWLDTCPTNWNKDGSRVQNNGPTPNFEITNDDFGEVTIRFFVDEQWSRSRSLFRMLEGIENAD